jgi:hypothetical protein
MCRFFLPLSLSIVLFSFLPASADSATSPGALDLGAWKLQTLNGATGTLSITTDAPDGGPCVVVDAQTSGSGEKWVVQMAYPTSVIKGKKYHLKFMMKSVPDTYIFIGVTQLQAPYAALCDGRTLQLSSDWQEIDYDFTPKADESNARILLTNLNVPGSKFYVANMTLGTE